MITKYSNAPALYDALFKKADTRLAKLGIRNEDGSTIEIKSLEEYFHHLRDLIYGSDTSEKDIVDDETKYLFLKLPLDEPHFIIDANSREIDTSEFDGVLSVQDDEVAEIVFFEIDRFFDATDLSLMNISIQWEVGSGNSKDSGHTPAFIRDIESKADEDKLIFGWPITSEITSHPGVLTFSVRFYQINEVTKEVIYSFSTLPKKINISSGLTIDVVNVTPDDATGLILGRLMNSPMGGVGNAKMPYFTSFNNVQIFDEITENTLLYAVATKGDSGALTYCWFKDDGVKLTPDDWKPANAIEEGYGAYVKTDRWIDGIATYYYLEGEKYQSIPVAEEDFAGQIEAHGELYVNCAAYTLTPGMDAGEYYIDAKNKFYNTFAYASGGDKGVQGTDVSVLPRWVVSGPEDIVITESGNLPAELLMSNDDSKTLTITANGLNDKTQYQWIYSAIPNGEETVKSTESNSYTPDAEGYYKVKMINTKNNVSKEAVSNQTLAIFNISDFSVILAKDGNTLTASLNRVKNDYETISYEWAKQDNGSWTTIARTSENVYSTTETGLYKVFVVVNKGSLTKAVDSSIVEI